MHVFKMTWQALTCAAALAVASHVQADSDVVALGTFVAQSDAIVIGVVSQVTIAGTTPGGAHTARIEVQQTLQGNARASIELAGNYRNPDDPMFVQGVRVLVFLRGSTPIGAGAGVVELADDGAATQAATIVTRALRGEWASASYRDVFLRTGTRVPRPLLASLLEELSGRLTQDDDRLLAEASCDRNDVYLPAVRGWAIGQAGRRKVADTRVCLEELTVSGTATQFVEQAIDALGDLGDARSAPVLMTLLNEAMRLPERDGPRGSAGTLPAAVLALGKIGDPNVVPTLLALAQGGDNLPLHSTVVHALGLIGTPAVDVALDTIGRAHPNPAVRDQAQKTLQQLRLSRPRRIQ